VITLILPHYQKNGDQQGHQADIDSTPQHDMKLFVAGEVQSIKQ